VPGTAWNNPPCHRMEPALPPRLGTSLAQHTEPTHSGHKTHDIEAPVAHTNHPILPNVKVPKCRSGTPPTNQRKGICKNACRSGLIEGRECRTRTVNTQKSCHFWTAPPAGNQLRRYCMTQPKSCKIGLFKKVMRFSPLMTEKRVLFGVLESPEPSSLAFTTSPPEMERVTTNKRPGREEYCLAC